MKNNHLTQSPRNKKFRDDLKSPIYYDRRIKVAVSHWKIGLHWGGEQPKVWKGGGCASNMSWNYRWVLCSLPSSNLSSPSISPDCRWLIVQSFNIGSKSLRNFPHLLFVSAILVKLKMKLQKKISVAKKAVRKTKPVLIPTIKWTMTDNLCLLYAIWEMRTPLQKLILTVIQLSTCI